MGVGPQEAAQTSDRGWFDNLTLCALRLTCVLRGNDLRLDIRLDFRVRVSVGRGI